MTLNEELQGQISACLQRTYICIIYTSHRMIRLSVYELSVKISPKMTLGQVLWRSVDDLQ